MNLVALARVRDAFVFLWRKRGVCLDFLVCIGVQVLDLSARIRATDTGHHGAGPSTDNKINDVTNLSLCIYIYIYIYIFSYLFPRRGCFSDVRGPQIPKISNI